MSRRRAQDRGPHRADHAWVEQVVDECRCPGSLRESYVSFALELLSTLRHRPGFGFSPATRRVVRKWFGRGLSGKLMWLIGQALVPSPGGRR